MPSFQFENVLAQLLFELSFFMSLNGTGNFPRHCLEKNDLTVP